MPLSKIFARPKSSRPADKPANAIVGHLSPKKLRLVRAVEPEQILSAEQITIGPLIGSGGFAKVHRCELEGKTCVAKMVDSSRLNEEMLYLLTNECTIWSHIEHPHIANFLGMASTSAAVLLVCEYFPDGALSDKLLQLRRDRAPLPEPLQVVSQLLQIASGLAYLHALEPIVLHRDLKSANILLSDGGQRLAIADFGLARYQETGGKAMTAETGSYRWMAPEVIRHEHYNQACDVYSFAILAWEMCTYRVPFEHLTPVEAALAVAREGKRPPIPDQWADKPVAQMLKACWHQEAPKRPPFSTVVAALEEEVELLQPAAAPYTAGPTAAAPSFASPRSAEAEC